MNKVALITGVTGQDGAYLTELGPDRAGTVEHCRKTVCMSALKREVMDYIVSHYNLTMRRDFM